MLCSVSHPAPLVAYAFVHKLIKQLLQIVGKAAANVLCCATVSSLAPPVCTSFLSSCRRQ